MSKEAIAYLESVNFTSKEGLYTARPIFEVIDDLEQCATYPENLSHTNDARWPDPFLWDDLDEDEAEFHPILIIDDVQNTFWEEDDPE